MTANIWRDGKIVFWGIGVLLTASPDLPVSRECEGTFRIIGNEPFDVAGHYRLELEDGDSADIALTHVFRRECVLVHFRVIAWKSPSRALNSAQGI